MNQKGFAPILIILSIVLLLGVAGGAYYLQSKEALPHFGQSTVKTPTSVSQVPVSTSQTSISPTQSVAKTTISPTPTVINETADLKAEIIYFKQDPSLSTYTDNKAKFSVQYGANGKIASSEEGKEVSFLSCIKDPKLTNGKDELCLQGFSIQVYDDYNGGSRREWLLNKNSNLKTYELSYEDVVVSGVKTLIVSADDSGSLSWTYVLMPKNNKMYQLFYPGGRNTRDNVKGVLSTFKFLN